MVNHSTTMRFAIGQPVCKTGGDYHFNGLVVAAFRKLSGAVRYVVEDDRGLLFIFGDANLMPDLEPGKPTP